MQNLENTFSSSPFYGKEHEEKMLVTHNIENNDTPPVESEKESEKDRQFQTTLQESNKELWYSHINYKGKKTIELDYVNTFAYLEANGFYRVYYPDKTDSEIDFVKIDNGVIKRISAPGIREFFYRYAVQNCKDRDILNYLADKLGGLLSKRKLERLKIIEDNFDHAEPDVQNLHFKNCQIRIMSSGIEQSTQRMEMVWENRIINRNFKRIPLLEKVEKIDDGHFDIALTEAGRKCEFLQFITNTSNFWKNEPELSEEKQRQMEVNIINKMTAIGYLCTDYKYESEKVAVVAMDAKISAVGTSNGRTGKSILAQAISKILSKKTLYERSIKKDFSYKPDQIAYVPFSDWYSIDHRPIHDFGHEFFTQWDDEQWCLFDNFMAECIMLYLNSRDQCWAGDGSGIVPPTMQNLEARQMRQRMGEVFLQWAEMAFSKSSRFINQRIDRKVLYNNFCEEFPGQRQFVSSKDFSNKLKTFCKYAGLHFNPHKVDKDGINFSQWIKDKPSESFMGGRDASGGKDYFAVCTTDHAKLSTI